MFLYIHIYLPYGWTLPIFEEDKIGLFVYPCIFVLVMVLHAVLIVALMSIFPIILLSPGCVFASVIILIHMPLRKILLILSSSNSTYPPLLWPIHLQPPFRAFFPLQYHS